MSFLFVIKWKTADAGLSVFAAFARIERIAMGYPVRGAEDRSAGPLTAGRKGDPALDAGKKEDGFLSYSNPCCPHADSARAIIMSTARSKRRGGA